MIHLRWQIVLGCHTIPGDQHKQNQHQQNSLGMSNKNNLEIYKYPRTPHLESSRLQPGDEDLDSVPFQMLADQYLVVTEKMDGANVAVSFTDEGELLLQSRGHYLSGGPRELQFTLFKQWASAHQAALWSALRERYVMYGEWLYAKHTLFYNHLPHYFIEFDILDKVERQFLSRSQRRLRLTGLPVVSANVLLSGKLDRLEKLRALLGPSPFIQPGHIEQLRQICRERGLDTERVFQETDQSRVMEGLYIKVEDEQTVKARYKYVRADFQTTLLQSGSHWLTRPLIPNQLASGVDIFATAL